jgi:hypothetical protein
LNFQSVKSYSYLILGSITKSQRFNFKNPQTEDEYKKSLHEKWEEDKRKNTEKKDIHYSDIKFDGSILKLY